MTLFTTLRAATLAAALLACARAESKPAGIASASAAVPATPTAASADTTVRAADRGRTLGDSTAKVWVVMISDFQCPYCKRWHDESFAAIRKDYVATGKVRIAFLNLPLGMHPNARPAAEAAMCASAQGKFWEMHDALFTTQERWAPESDASNAIDSAAAHAGVDAARMRACVKAGTMRAMVEQDMRRAGDAGAKATPSFVVGEQFVEGAVPLDELRKAIDAALAGTSAPPAPTTAGR
jgi:protein-disulfide isomerase